MLAAANKLKSNASHEYKIADNRSGDFQTGIFVSFWHALDFIWVIRNQLLSLGMPQHDLKCPLLTLVDLQMTLNLPFSWVINLFSSSVGVVLIFKTISSFLWFFNAVSISALELFKLSKVRRRRFACLNIKILNHKGQDAKLKTWWRSKIWGRKFWFLEGLNFWFQNF